MIRQGLALLIMISAFSCSSENSATPALGPDEQAKAFYDSLIAGNAGAFVRGMYFAGDTITPAYRKQLETNALMTLEVEKIRHSELKAVEVSSVEKSKDGSTASVFLTMHYADKSVESIVVAMERHDGRWYMR